MRTYSEESARITVLIMHPTEWNGEFSINTDQQLKHAHELITKGEVDAGRKLCEEVIASRPDSGQAYYLLAVAAFFAGDDFDFKQNIDRMMEIEPDDIRSYGLLCRFHNNRGNHHGVIECCRKTLSIQQDMSQAKQLLGDALLCQGKLPEAENHLRSLARTNPADIYALNSLGQALLEQDKFEEATACFNQVLAIDSQNVVAQSRLGAALFRSGEADKARELLEQVISSAPEFPDPHKTLGDLLHAAGQLETAIAEYQTYLESKHGLTGLATAFRTDKWGSHYYAKHYHDHFYPLRNRELKLLEIGVGGYEHPHRGGASLRMWKAFFPNTSIYSIDIHDKSALQEERIEIFRGSQDDPEFLRQTVLSIGKLDLIIDDGSHINSHVIDTFRTLFPLLANDGIYVIEDTQTAYWPDFGGSSEISPPNETMQTFFKALTDGLNYEERLWPDYKPDYFNQHIVAIHFYHNMVFIYKGDNREGSNLVVNGALSIK